MELIRRSVRKFIASDSFAYRVASSLVTDFSVMRREGIGACVRLRRMMTAEPSDAVALNFSALKYPFFARPGTDDVLTAVINFVREVYGKFSPPSKPRWMIDGGAYIGDTSAYFLSRFPTLRVVALEPNSESYALAEKNLRPYGHSAILLSKGLWSVEGSVRFGGASTAAGYREGGVEIVCTTIPALIEKYGIPRIDILKLDIEGAEHALFSVQPETWLKHVNLLIVEIHWQGAFDLIEKKLGECGFSMRQYRSIWYCSR